MIILWIFLKYPCASSHSCRRSLELKFSGNAYLMSTSKLQSFSFKLHQKVVEPGWSRFSDRVIKNKHSYILILSLVKNVIFSWEVKTRPKQNEILILKQFTIKLINLLEVYATVARTKHKRGLELLLSKHGPYY